MTKRDRENENATAYYFPPACTVTLFSGLLLSGGSTYAKEWKSITIATEGGYEPRNLTLPGGKLSGFEPELMANLCQRMQIECKLVVQNWDGMIAGLNAGKYDVIMDAIVVTPERSKVVAFTQAYAATPASFIAVKGRCYRLRRRSSFMIMRKRFRRRLRRCARR